MHRENRHLFTCYQLIHGAKQPPAYCPNKQLIVAHKVHSSEFYVEKFGGWGRVTQRQLENAGYTVTGTNSSREALKNIQDNPEQFDLLITDQTMPGLTGVELAKAVMKLNPGLPIILFTGHSNVVSKEESLAMGIRKFIKKPVVNDELMIAVQSVFGDD